MSLPPSSSAVSTARITSVPAGVAAESSAPWQADCGDGQYRNPILFADYSDPDAIRVGDDYWMTSSSFCAVPGLPILHSRDLVNWTLVNHALPRLVPAEHFSRPRHGQGVWAPALRFHAGRFWIFYPDPDFGLYVITALDPRGAWSAPVKVKAGKGLIDPCPFWDDDGQAYLVHGWAKSRSGICNLLTLHRLSADGLSVTDVGRTVIDGAAMPGWKTIEGPKLYKRNGYYYIFAPAGGVTEGYQAVFRARAIDGPYENRIVLEQGSTPVNGPHQGAWVETPTGEHWFLHFQEMPAYGRVVHLQPVRWSDDWPAMGEVADGVETRQPVLVHAKPAASPASAAAQAPAAPATSDEFVGWALGLQWQWQANPSPGWAEIDARRGGLRLRCAPLTDERSHWTAGHLLMQKFPAPEFCATTSLRLAAVAEGDRAGLIVFGFQYAWLGLRRSGGRAQLVLSACEGAQKGGLENDVVAIDAATDEVALRVTVAPGARYQFSYAATAGGPFVSIGAEFQASSSFWVGAKVGLFASARPVVGASAEGAALAGGYADFGFFRVSAAEAESETPAGNG